MNNVKVSTGRGTFGIRKDGKYDMRYKLSRELYAEEKKPKIEIKDSGITILNKRKLFWLGVLTFLGAWAWMAIQEPIFISGVVK